MNATLVRRAAERPRTTTMKAAVLAAPGEFRIEEIAVPEPTASQVLVRLEGCGVCASNIPRWEGRSWFEYPMSPGALGHEGWGTVAAVGADVGEFSEGERVAMISYHAYAEFDLGEIGSLVKLPDKLDDQSFPAEPLGCAMNIFKRSEIKRGDYVAIIGIGFLGALLSQLAAAAGAHVIAINRRSYALQFARAADKLLLDEHVAGRVKQITGGRMCNVVIEAVGKQNALDLAGELTCERGRLVIAGYHQDGLRQINMQLWNWRGLDVINAHERDPAVYLEGMQRAVAAVESGLLDPAPLYTHRFPLDQIGEAFRMAGERPDGFMKALMIYDR
ncbi:MAG: zinc-binding dehydrogenase [Chthoniobacterales bacterium]